MPRRNQGRFGRGAIISVLAHAVVIAAILWRPVVHVWAPPQHEATVAVLMTHGQGDLPAAGSGGLPKPAPAAPKPPAALPVPPAPPKPQVAAPAPPAPPHTAKVETKPAPAPVAKPPPPRPKPEPMEFGALGGPSFRIRESDNKALTVATKPDQGNLAPTYPPEAARRHEAGTVALVLHIAADGFVDRVDVIQSSGYPLLDQAAVSRLRTWHFTPATRGGIPVPSIYKIAVSFGP